MRKKWVQTGILAGLLIALALLLLNRQAVRDWLLLVRYSPPVAVTALARDDTMTPKAEHLFYVNHPDITAGSDFTGHCPAGSEKTVVLGCYVGNDGGIYIYRVTDSRLEGVEQVTAAHEMLHAAYRRLSTAERNRVDAMLTDFYTHGLHDERIKSTIEAYRSSEPNDLANEMHSIFGSEVAELPPALETYYQRYFTDRAKVTAYTAAYQAEFTSRRQQVAAYDVTLKSLKQQIDADKASLQQQQTALDVQKAQLEAERSSDQTAAYNAAVSQYNQAVEAYNRLLQTTKDEIARYNDIVDRRNTLALEERQLVQAISPGSVPSSP
jgi:hypothetical protein